MCVVAATTTAALGALVGALGASAILGGTGGGAVVGCVGVATIGTATTTTPTLTATMARQAHTPPPRRHRSWRTRPAATTRRPAHNGRRRSHTTSDPTRDHCSESNQAPTH